MSSHPLSGNISRRLMAAVLFLLLLSVGPVAAMDLYTYDLDSLAYQSTEIVEADLGGPGKADGYPVTTATVTAVYKGHFRPGQQISLTALDFFRKANPDARFGYWYDTKPLLSDDRVFLFLVRATKQFLYDIPATAEVYWPVFGGVKLVVHGRALGFQQYNNPGPYVSDLPGTKEPTVAAFKASLSQSLKTAQRFAPVLDPEPDKKNVPALMQVLRERTHEQPNFRQRDAIAEAACARLAALQDPKILDQATQIATGWPEMQNLDNGFATPQGRQYLLGKIADKSLPLTRRRQLAGILYATGLNWPHPVPSESQIITQIARLAESNADAEPLCLALLDIVSRAAMTINQLRSQKFSMHQLEHDFQSALSVLTAFYRQTHSEPIRYQIETIEAREGLGAYKELHPTGGPILSLVSTVRRETRDGKTVLGIDYSVSSPFASEPGAMPEFVLMNSQTRREQVLPLTAGWGEEALRNGGGVSANNVVPLPPDLPPAIYHVFLRFRQDGRIISIGHSCRVSL